MLLSLEFKDEVEGRDDHVKGITAGVTRPRRGLEELAPQR